MLHNLLIVSSSAHRFLDRIINNREIWVLNMSINNDNGHHPLNMNYLPANLGYIYKLSFFRSIQIFKKKKEN